MVDVLAEDDGLPIGVRAEEVVDELGGHESGALVEHQHPIHVALVVHAVFDELAQVVDHAGRRPPPLQVPVEIDADDLVGGEEPILDALLQAVGVDGLPK